MEIAEVKADLLKGLKNIDETREKLEKRFEEVGDVKEALAQQDASMKTMMESLASNQKATDEMQEMLSRPGVLKGTDEKAQEMEKKAFSKFLRGKDAELTLDEKNLLVGDDARGGYFVPAEMSKKIIEKNILLSPVRQVAQKFTISSDTLQLPKEEAFPTVGRSTETGTRSASTTEEISMVNIPVHEYYSLIKITQKLLEDSAFDVESWITGLVGKVFAQKEGTDFISGNAVTRPEGILTNADITTAATTSSVAAGFSYDDIITLSHSIDAIYAQNATFMAERATQSYIRKFKDQNNNYLFRIGEPIKEIEGAPNLEADDLETVASSAEVALYGDFAEGYGVVDRTGILLIRDVYSSKTTGLVELMFRRRVGGGVLQPAALAKLICGA